MTPSKKRILLVDDDADLLRLLSIRLTGNGYEVNLAQSAEEALALLPVIRPQLVITDLRMEGMDGMALYDAIRKANSSLPVIILTAHGSIPDAVEATQRGVFTFLTKPVNSREFLRDVERAMSLSPSGSEVQGGQEWRREIITQSPVMEDLLSKAHLAAASGTSVLIRGESGTGKELLARAIHLASPRAARPFVAVNCGAIPDSLLESELFGHTKGSFTGADRNYAGLFRSAEGGTLFLDEIGDMPLVLQVKLLRVLQEKQVRSIGSPLATNINVRIISATHRVLEDEIQEGTFREDLYYRLNVVSLELPTLFERREDIPLLANYFLHKFTSEAGKSVSGFSPEAMEVLIGAGWPGNIRQLCNVVEQAVTLSTGQVISSDLVQNAIRETPEEILSFADARRQFEQDYLVQLLKMTNGNVTQAARLAKRNRTEFYKLLNRHHIAPTLFK